MSLFSDLCNKYGGASLIPHFELYELIQSQRTDLEKRHELDVQSTAKRIKDMKQYPGLKPHEKIDYVIPNSEIGKEVRRRCERELEWLGAFFCWETNPEGTGKPISDNLMCRENHGPMIDFFIKKDKTKSIAEQDTIKNRLLLMPRGSMKSTWNILNAVQWILNFPEIRILFLTAADDLAVGLVEELKAHFIEREDCPTLMNMFFPEFSVDEAVAESGAMGFFTCPVWAGRQQRRKEATVEAAGVTTTLSGRHYECIVADDAVSNRNSENEEQCLKVSKNFAVNKKMLRPFGYCDKIGTRYHDEDMYGLDLQKNLGEVERTEGPGWELTINRLTSTKVLIGRAITIKPDVLDKFQKLNTQATYADAGEEGCILLMPKVLPYHFLVADHAKDDEAFEGQMNQNPRPPLAVVFDLPLLKKCTVSHHSMPFQGPRVQFWDLAYSHKKGRDYSVGVCGVWDGSGVMYVHDMKRDRYNTPSKLATAIVEFAREWRPFVVGIEDTQGVRWLHDSIMLAAKRYNDPELSSLLTRIDWVRVDKQKNAKIIRMTALQPLLEHGSLKFANYLPNLQTLYDEFERCLHSARHDDIPDAIAQMCRYMPKIQQILGDPERRRKFLSEAELNEAWRNLIFEENTDQWGRPGLGYIAPVDPTANLVDEDFLENNSPGLENMLGGGLTG